jgi:hypothetical protein
MTSKEEFIQKYREYKSQHHTIPKARDFLKFAGVHSGVLTRLYGRDASSKLQQECGDEANKLSLVRMPLEAIMRQYGDLALRLNESLNTSDWKLPNTSDWMQSGLKPTLSGLKQPPHSIVWSEFPRKFSDWIESEGIKGYEKVIEFIALSPAKSKSSAQERDREFEKLVGDIRSWSPARGRNKEETYKVELRGHLMNLGYEVNEEFGESNIDLRINKKYMVEIKKDPNLGEYDRLFGQLARHLQYHPFAIAVLFEAHRDDIYNNFAALVDSYLNKEKKTVEIIKK